MGEGAAGGNAGEFFALARALAAFKAGTLSGAPSDRVLAQAAEVSPFTIGEWLRGTRFPQDIDKVLIVVRKVRALADARGVARPAGLLEENLWRAAHREEARRRAGAVSDAVQRAQAATVLAAQPPGVRVGEADLRRLGVHEAISVPGIVGGVLPEYVTRDVDTAESGVRARLEATAQRGGFVLLVGGSSVGKTRCAAEAIRALLPDWQLVHPAGPDQVAALAAAPTPGTVVWLDELQRYFDGKRGLTGGVVRALLDAPGPVVIIGTLWPDRYTAWTAPRTSGDADPHPLEREVLDLADVVRIAPAFSPAEQDRTRIAADHDPQLRAALSAGGYGLTQTLAAAPQLVARWEDAQVANPYAWAVLTAALDAARLGARGPLSADLLRAAAPGYCTSAQQAEAPDGWFEHALAYATKKLHGAAAALSPAAAGMGQIAGYTAADYLIQYATRERHYARAPASFWDALPTHVRDPADAARLADSARDRMQYRYAIPLFRRAAETGDGHAPQRLAALTGDGYAAQQLATLLTKRSDLDGVAQVLRPRADAGDADAARQLAKLLAERGDLDGLRARAEAGDTDAAWKLAALLKERGDLDGAAQVLRASADAGDADAAWKLADLLEERGDLDGLGQVLRAPADAGDRDAAWKLADLLAERGDLDGLRARADAGDTEAAFHLADRLEERGDLDGLEQVLRAWADVDVDLDAGGWDAAQQLAALLKERGDLDGLRGRADSGDGHAARQLAELLAERGDLDGLRARADTGDGDAAWRLAHVQKKRGDLDGLRGRADAGDSAAAWQLAELLEERGDLDEAERVLRAQADADDHVWAQQLVEMLVRRGDPDGLRGRADAGDWYAARQLAELLARRGDLDGLRARADTGDWYAAQQLVALLKERGDLDGLRVRVGTGDWHAAEQLAGLLEEHGDLDGAAQVLRAPADAGRWDAARQLVRLLKERGDLDGAAQVLRARADTDADADDRTGARGLATLLAERGDLDELRTRADAGDRAAAWGLARLLEERGDLDGLRARVDSGDADAAQRLGDVLERQGRSPEADQLRRFGLNPDGSIASA